MGVFSLYKFYVGKKVLKKTRNNDTIIKYRNVGGITFIIVWFA